MKPKHQHGARTCAVLACVVACATIGVSAQAPIEIKVVVVTMFERGADTGDVPGELQHWVEREGLDLELPFPQGGRSLRTNTTGVLAVCTGVGTAKAAASIMALGLDPRFDLRRAYWVVAGIAGIDPEDGSTGSAVWADGSSTATSAMRSTRARSRRGPGAWIGDAFSCCARRATSTSSVRASPRWRASRKRRSAATSRTCPPSTPPTAWAASSCANWCVAGRPTRTSRLVDNGAVRAAAGSRQFQDTSRPARVAADAPQSARELFLRCYKKHAAAQGVTYAQALDEALCFGWIDGVTRRLDADSYCIRFSPRKPRSIWSRINVGHATRLIEAGRMEKAGRAAFDAREAVRTGVYSFEQPPATLDAAGNETFKANARAWAWFEQQPPWYRRLTVFWVMSGKKEETRARRLATLIDCCARGVKIPGIPAGR